ncbi:type II secretion system F family protein [Alicyclobacillus sp. SO9]|uniref:type II secretion system F family protein n=1 Tax=Alicyclobacillus sp. SO9 TaxID=2665646 RepID=UPI0018E8327F|nr:type II secretion system F family protein [Alicyclobacillus sp. SO9]QQE79454.1 type II secretion system F family protein [Alicyclobacillus sp. SO9]
MVTIVVLGAASVFLFVWSLLRLAVETRLNVGVRVVEVQLATEAKDPKKSNRLRPRRMFRQWQVLSHLEKLLDSAEIELSVAEFALRFSVITAVISLLVTLLVNIVPGILVWPAGFLTVAFYLRTRRQRRVNRFNDGLGDLLTIVANALRAGHSFAQSIHMVTQDMKGPVQEEFVRVEGEVQIGIGLEEALHRAATRVDSEDFNLIVTAIQIQRQVGGNLAEVLDKIADTIRDRVKLQREVKALTSQGRLSASIFMVLPAGVGAILFAVNPSYMKSMFHSPVGVALLILAALGQVVGLLIIRKIVRVEL